MIKQKQIRTAHTNNSKCTSAQKITNWSAYNKALVHRGNITILINRALLGNVPTKTGKPGHPVEYADAVILFLAQLREIMRLPLRQTIGLASSICQMAGLPMALPTYATLSRRLAALDVPSNISRVMPNQSIIFLPDSTGLKVSGEGEWKVKKHGADTRRQWVKVHLGTDYTSRGIVAVKITDHYDHDGPELPRLLDQVPAACTVSEIVGDGAYGSKGLYDEAKARDIMLLVPPPKNAIWHGDIKNGQLVDAPGWETRNSYVRSCLRIGRKAWKHQSGYHRRSLAETSMYRLKRTFGGSLRSRTRPNQEAEVNIRISLLNLFASYGMPAYDTA
jgi:hypothetical protein